MAVTKKKSRQSSTKERSPAKSIDGLKKAATVRRQLDRWREQQWPLTEASAAEWLRFGHALKAQADIIIGDALRRVDPSHFPSRASPGADSS